MASRPEDTGSIVQGDPRDIHGDVCQVSAVHSSEDYASDPKVWDLVIVGAGIAGCALAFSNAKDGRRVLLLERDLSQPDRIVGELLQPGGYLKLKELGLAHCVDGIDSQKVFGYCMFREGKQARVRYPTQGMAEDVAGRSFHNGRFVQRLRQAAASQPRVTVRSGTVTRLLDGLSLVPSTSALLLELTSSGLLAPELLKQGQEWPGHGPVQGVQYKAGGAVRTATAALTLVCDGMYSSLRRKLSTPIIRHPSYFVGLILRGCSLPWPNFGHVVLARPSPILFYPISSTEVRCLVDVQGDKLPSASSGALQAHLETVVAPQVPEQLRASFLEAAASGEARSMQNKCMPASPLHCPGALLLGDAFNMRHPLTGGGMTVALGDAALLCGMLRPLPDLGNAAATAQATASFYSRRTPLSTTINTLANALYQVFSWGESTAHVEMQKACFDYLALGGWYSEGPVSLLSGLNPRPAVLVMHFFAVAVYGFGRLQLPRPTFKGLWQGLCILWCAAGIILPIIYAEGLRRTFLPLLAVTPQVRSKLSSRR